MSFAKLAGTLALVCLLVACGSGANLPPLPAEGKVLAFGDSLTFGTGGNSDESYPAVLQRLIGREVVNAGVPGEITAEGLQRLPALLEEVHPRLLILCHGGNDFLRNYGEKQAADNIRAMIRLAKDRGVGVVLIAVPRFGILLSAAEFYGKVADEFEIPIEAETLSRIIRDNTLKSDPIHPNGKGYKILAEAVARSLREAGAI